MDSYNGQLRGLQLLISVTEEILVERKEILVERKLLTTAPS